MFIKFYEAILIFAVSILITRYLGPANYGKLNYFLSIVFIIKPLYILGSNFVLQAELSRNKNNQSIINQLFTIRFFGFLIISILALSTSFVYMSYENIILFLILQLSSGFRIVDLFTKSLFIFNKSVESVKINFISSLKLLIIVSVSYLRKSSIYTIAIAYLINYLTDIILVMIILKRNSLFYIFSNLKIDFSNFKKNLLKGLPIMGSNLISILLIRLDVILIANIIDEFYAGIYSAPCRIVIQVNILLNLISLNLIPKLKNNFSTKNYKNSDKLYIFTWLYSFLCSILFLFLTPIIITFGFGSEFVPSIKLLPILSLVVFLNGLSLTDNAFLNFYNFGKIIFFKSLISLFINILFNIILIPLIGLQGALISLLFSSLFNSFGGILFDKKLNNHYRNLILPNFKKNYLFDM